jgi:two-component system, NtrC family, sensor histidine kinase HydH
MTVSDIMTPPVPLNLRRRFALASLAVIAAIAIGLGWTLSRVLTERMLEREGKVTWEFVENLLNTDQSADYFKNPTDPVLRARFLDSMKHLTEMRDAVRANAYSRDRQVLWSSNKQLVGERYDDNTELDQALRGELVVHYERLLLSEAISTQKTEHAGMHLHGEYFIETYMPIRARDSGTILGVMEVYKHPAQLNVEIQQSLRQLWLACLLSAIVLFVSLYWIVARADRELRARALRLTEAQSLASAVELASAVAHNLRNPLASIRSAAEMVQTTEVTAQTVREMSTDVIDAVDRANRWITELVHVAQAPQLQPEAVHLDELVQNCMQEMAPEFSRRHIVCTAIPNAQMRVCAHSATLRQILLSILANAAEAMPGGGTLEIRWSSTETLAGLRVCDTGTGISTEVQQRLFRPFFSTKGGGLGIGLALVKRMVEQWHGQLRLTPQLPHGTCVEILLPRS